MGLYDDFYNRQLLKRINYTKHVERHLFKFTPRVVCMGARLFWFACNKRIKMSLHCFISGHRINEPSTLNAVFTLGIFTAVKEFTYLGKFLVNVNIN